MFTFHSFCCETQKRRNCEESCVGQISKANTKSCDSIRRGRPHRRLLSAARIGQWLIREMRRFKHEQKYLNFEITFKILFFKDFHWRSSACTIAESWATSTNGTRSAKPVNFMLILSVIFIQLNQINVSFNWSFLSNWIRLMFYLIGDLYPADPMNEQSIGVERKREQLRRNRYCLSRNYSDELSPQGTDTQPPSANILSFGRVWEEVLM